MAGDTSGSVNQRFYGYRLADVTGNEAEKTKNRENESPKHRAQTSMNCYCGFMKVTGFTLQGESHRDATTANNETA